MADFTFSSLTGPAHGLDMDGLNIGGLNIMSVATQNAGLDALYIPIPPNSPFDLLSDATVFGTGLGYSALDQLLTGTIQSLDLIHYNPAGRASISITGIADLPAKSLQGWVNTNDTQSLFNNVLAGNDVGHGSLGPDVMRGYGGNDTLSGGAGADSIYGGQGDDLIYGSSASGEDSTETDSNYLRGEDGNDTIIGSPGFDDINGNQGDDVLHGGPGDDWVVGGKGDDSQTGDAGDDIVWGNLGNDTLSGGSGNDQVRGGQGDDSISGGAGNDFISGDRGNDTESGGPGADIFHGSQDAGIDKVLDFNQTEGDRVMLDPGTTYTVSQVGSDTVIDMGGGNQMILVGVQLSTLKDGWIFEG